MQISELARQAAVSVHALRHYERLGLIRPHRRANGYRDYPASMRREVVFIAMSRQLGFALPQIAQRLADYRAGTLGIDDRPGNPVCHAPGYRTQHRIRPPAVGGRRGAAVRPARAVRSRRPPAPRAPEWSAPC